MSSSRRILTIDSSLWTGKMTSDSTNSAQDLMLGSRECPSAETWNRFSAGRVANEELSLLGRHLDSCECCQSTLARIHEHSDIDDSVVGAFRSSDPMETVIDSTAYLGLVSRVVSGSSAEFANLEWENDLERKAPVVGSQLDQYRLNEELGKGGMGVVYRATDMVLECDVAVKILDGPRIQSPRLLKRFIRERKVIASLDHPNIVRARSAGESGGYHYLAMDYVDGVDLQKLVRRDGPMDLANACEVIAQVSSALGAIADAGLVHRDVKPSNLMVDKAGVAKVLDLGLARIVDESYSSISCEDSVMGTADYVAPEQVSSGYEIDIRADIYSLGCTFFYLLAGRPPYQDAEFKGWYEKVRAHKEEPIPNIREFRQGIPETIATLITQMLAKDRDDRIQSPGNLVIALEACRNGADLPRIVAAPNRTRRKHRIPIVGLKMLMMLLIFTLAVVLLKPGEWFGESQPDWVQRVSLIENPGKKGVTDWKWNAKEELLLLTTDRESLLELGEVESQRFQLSIEIQQPSWPGNIGLILGCRTVQLKGQRRIVFQVIRILRIERDGQVGYEIRREKQMFSPLTGAFSDVVPLHRDEAVDDRSSAPIGTPNDSRHRLEIVVGPRGLETLIWAGIELDNLVTPSANRAYSKDDYLGKWGLYLGHTAWIGQPKLTELTENVK